jgi:hypothetical protein
MIQALALRMKERGSALNSGIDIGMINYARYLERNH